MLSAVSLLSPKATPMLAESDELVPGHLRAAGERLQDPVAGLVDLGRVHVLEQQRELVAAEPGDGVALPHTAGEPLGHVDQHRVAGGVAEAVVDRLEAVQVHEEQRDPGAAAPGHLQRVLDPVEQQSAVRQVGEEVVAGQVGHVLGQPEPGERVGGDRDHRLEGLLVGRRGRPGPVPGGRDDPAVALAVAQLGADLGGARRSGPDLDVADAQQPLRVVDERVQDLAGVGEGLRANRCVEEHGEPARVLAAAGDGATGDQQGGQRHREQGQRPPRVGADHDRPEVAQGVEGHEA